MNISIAGRRKSGHFLLVLVSFSLNYRGRKNQKWIAANVLLSSHYIDVLLPSSCAWQPEKLYTFSYRLLETKAWFGSKFDGSMSGRYDFLWDSLEVLRSIVRILRLPRCWLIPLLLVPCITNWSKMPVVIDADQKGFFPCYLRTASVVLLLQVNWGQWLAWGRDHFP